MDGAVSWDVARLDDLAVHGLLEQGVDALGLRQDVFGILDFCADGDGEVVAGIARQAEFLAVVEFEYDSHNGTGLLPMVFLVGSRHVKTRSHQEWPGVAWTGSYVCRSSISNPKSVEIASYQAGCTGYLINLSHFLSISSPWRASAMSCCTLSHKWRRCMPYLR